VEATGTSALELLPVAYGGEMGPDLPDVADLTPPLLPLNHAVSGLCSGKRDTQRDTTRIPAGATAPAGRHPTLVAADALQFDTIVTTKGGER